MENDAPQLGLRLSGSKHPIFFPIPFNARFSSIAEDPHSDAVAYSYHGNYAS